LICLALDPDQVCAGRVGASVVLSIDLAGERGTADWYDGIGKSIAILAVIRAEAAARAENAALKAENAALRAPIRWVPLKTIDRRGLSHETVRRAAVAGKASSLPRKRGERWIVDEAAALSKRGSGPTFENQVDFRHRPRSTATPDRQSGRPPTGVD